MPTVTISDDLLARLDELAASAGHSRDDFVERALNEFVSRQMEDDVPDWHIPLVRAAVDQVRHGQLVDTTANEIIAKANARRG